MLLRRDRLIPAIVASPLFLQNLDSSVMVTALPSIATSLAVPPLHLNLAITAYLLSLAVFLPLSGWLADRLGARRVFCMAIALFSLASTLCGLASSLPELVVFRILQGMGGAMMVPVGRLILLRAVPPVIGRMMGPLFGGAIVTYANWRWIFLVNIPFGLLAIALTLAFVRDDPPAVDPVPF
jgi:MFS family permease